MAGAYDFAGLRDLDQLWRVLEIALIDALALDNSIARVRALAYLVQVGLGLMDKTEFEARLAVLEAAVKAKAAGEEVWFDYDLEDLD